MIQIRIPAPKLVEISKLKPYGKNIKVHTKEQINDLAKLMGLVGFKDPIVIDEKNMIWAGHGRLEAARQLGMTEVPCVYVEGLTEEQKKVFMIMDNKVNESAWIFENVKLVFDDVDPINFEKFEMDFTEYFERNTAPTEAEWQEYFDKEDTSEFINLRQITFSLTKNQVALLQSILRKIDQNPSKAIMGLVSFWRKNNKSS